MPETATPQKVNRKLEQVLKPHNDAYIAVVVNVLTALLFLRLPSSIRAFPEWLPLACVVALESVLLYTHFGSKPVFNQRVGFLLLLLQFGFLVTTVGCLIWGLPHNESLAGEVMLFTGARLWFANLLVFTIWYWRFDGGGPSFRDREECDHLSFLFPQMTMSEQQRVQVNQANWHPGVIDYLFLSFNTSTALSPSDTPVIGRAAKLTTMLQAMISLSIVVIVIGRSVNVM